MQLNAGRVGPPDEARPTVLDAVPGVPLRLRHSTRQACRRADHCTRDRSRGDASDPLHTAFQPLTAPLWLSRSSEGLAQLRSRAIFAL